MWRKTTDPAGITLVRARNNLECFQITESSALKKQKPNQTKKLFPVFFFMPHVQGDGVRRQHRAKADKTLWEFVSAPRQCVPLLRDWPDFQGWTHGALSVWIGVLLLRKSCLHLSRVDQSASVMIPDTQTSQKQNKNITHTCVRSRAPLLQERDTATSAFNYSSSGTAPGSCVRRQMKTH